MRILILSISFMFIFQIAWSQTKTNIEPKPQARTMDRISTVPKKAHAVKKEETPEDKQISKKPNVSSEKQGKKPENKRITKEPMLKSNPELSNSPEPKNN